MFDVANKIAYANLMVHGVEDDTNRDDWLGHSCWYDVRGTGDGHWVQAQGEAAMDLVHQLLESKTLGGQLKNARGEWHINVITPYKDVGSAFTAMLRQQFNDIDDIYKMTGTVHTFQGKEADVVILLLGGNPDKQGAVSFFAGNEQAPNLLNVALTRAKKRLYVVGDKQMWTSNSGTFRELADQLERHEKSHGAGMRTSVAA
ncbi:AAA domain-containing protein [Paucibacter sp. B2R-40]|uniref:DEAD/DEAH box helicase n=1 Tax=Paucibacter sp. B2R-40 TaxID=2893554 RepID=UPI0021E3D034|nr:C-terminal helicase domain-containing protein [Paucibacter sp. B2R-40]MCV2354027.1 AAA domain-containing protein [Paucibacter sp. B2R-40]